MDVETRRWWNGLGWVEIDPTTGGLVSLPPDDIPVRPALIGAPRAPSEPLSTTAAPTTAPTAAPTTCVTRLRRTPGQLPCHRAVPGRWRRTGRIAAFATAAGAVAATVLALTAGALPSLHG